MHGGKSQEATSRQPAALLGTDALQRLRVRDNRTNWRYLAQAYAVITATIGTALGLEHHIRSAGASLLWMIPVAIATILIIGAAQHQLGGAVHEGTHFMLFADRRLNELASDWLAAFPIYTSTYQFRVHHLAHHQFVNDPERDPDIAQLKESHHWLDFPVAHLDVVQALLKQLWPPNLIRYTLTRARYSALGFDENPYRDETRRPGIWPTRVGILFAVGAPVAAISLLAFGRGLLALVAVAGLLAAVIFYYARLPEDQFPGTRLEPVISHRATGIARMIYLGGLYSVLTIVQMTTGAPAWSYFGLYWILPLFSTFALFMILRQWVQHGNADRGRLTNTRVFLVGPLVRYAVFPWGMDYHLPHHLYASVPHYNLKALHHALLGNARYRAQAVIVETYFGREETGRLSAMAVMGAHADGAEAAHVDALALEYATVDGRDVIEARAQQSLWAADRRER
jgi:fatty acid desaturase